VSARFTAAEALILRNLVSQVADLMSGRAAETGSGKAGPGPEASVEDLAALLGPDGPAAAPDDPVLARLLPDAYRGDPDAAGEFRRYTEDGLRSGKIAAASTVLGTLPPAGGQVRLGAEDAQAWLRALNDIRLAFGVVLGITEDDQAEPGPAGEADTRSGYLDVYHWLSYLQESLVRALW
jgi:hypothetical protein